MKITKKNIIAMTVATIIILSSILLTGCNGDTTSSPDQAQSTQSPTISLEKDNTIATQNSSAASETISTTSKSSSDKATEKDIDNKSDNNSNNKNTDTPTNKSNISTSSKSNSSSDNTSSSGKSSSSSSSGTSNSSDKEKTDSHSGKTYHEAVYKTVHHDAEYENVYVVDKKAYSYEEPVYEERQITVCHVCGAEFDTSYSSSAFWDHVFEHEFAGEGSGYHSDVRKEQVGTNTVNVPEEGHYEKKVIKDAWDEKVLVREAGYY